VNIRAKDLNLLTVFEALLRDRNVSRAAKALKMTQPALSNALARLRRDLGDDLFVRNGKGMSPTPRALELQDEVAAILQNARSLYQKESFDPRADAGRFSIATTDYFETLLLPHLLPYLGKNAPGITTVVRPVQGIFPKAELESGQLDLAVAGFFGELPEGFYQRTLFEEGYSCLVRRDHPGVGEELTLDAYLALDHILVSPQGDMRGAVDQALERRGLRRRVIGGVANFHTPAAIVAGSDYIVTMPTRLAIRFTGLYPLRCLPPPIAVKGFKLVQVWHARTHGSLRHQWLRRAIEHSLEDPRM
jgi:DNA-binding transcriptional LysR family regulator